MVKTPRELSQKPSAIRQRRMMALRKDGYEMLPGPVQMANLMAKLEGLNYLSRGSDHSPDEILAALNRWASTGTVVKFDRR